LKKGIISILVILINAISSYCQGDPYPFSRLTSDDGLVNNQVLSIFKDSKGFVWFGTNAGLSRYDGFRFTNYVHQVNDSNTIADNYVLGIQELSSGDLLLETRWRYVLYDYKKDRFTNKIDEYFKNLVPATGYKSIYVDQKKQVWFIGYDNQLTLQDFANNRLYNPFKDITLQKAEIVDFIHHKNLYRIIYKSGVIEFYNDSDYSMEYHNDYLKGSLSTDNNFVKLFVDSDNDLWISTEKNGLFYHNSHLNTWDHCNMNSGKFKLSSNLLKKIIQDNDGNIWIATDHGGIDIINKSTGTVKTLFNRKEDPKSVSQNSIVDLFKDDLGIIWVATYKKGVCYYHESKFKFPHFYNVFGDPNSLPFNDVNCFSEDKKGNLWIGTNGNGLLYFNRKEKRYTHYRHNPTNPNSLSNDVIVSMYYDNDGILWLGTFTGGLCSFDGVNFKNYRNRKEDPESLPNDNIWTIAPQSNDKLLIGTLGSGVTVFDKKSGKCQSPASNKLTPVNSDYITCITPLRAGNLLIATTIGVALLDTESKLYKPWPRDKNGDVISLGNYMVNYVFEDSRGLIWIATREGLNVYDPVMKTLKIFSPDQGFSTGIFNCILEDNNRSIWVSKSDGVSKITVSQNENGYLFLINNFTAKDGLQDNEFNINSCLKTNSGELIFGGPNGFNMFLPQNVDPDREMTKMQFTDFLIFNKSLKADDKVGGKAILSQSMFNNPKIELPHRINVFSIEFTSFDYLISQKFNYRYKLEGFDNNWLELPSDNRRITYTNLNPGDYIFKICAVSIDGTIVAPESSLEITINPPFYLSIPALILYVIIVILSLIWMRYYILRRERAKFLIEQERIHARRNHEVDEMKLRFLTNVSHEFRTPLTLIITPVEQLMKEEQLKPFQGSLSIVQKNAKQLLALVNQLLDFRKLDSQGMTFNPSYSDAVMFVRDVTTRFSIEFENKNISFGFHTSIDKLNISFDREKLEKIVMNLLSNALKYTQENGEVKVDLSQNTNDDGSRWFVIRVSDTGIGIAADEHELIFERFYQSKREGSTAGSGIGLNLTREMVLLHNGNIRVESQPGSGSVFIVQIPCIEKNPINEDDERDGSETHLPETGEEASSRQRVILLVEDNRDLRNYLKDVLENHYNILTAENGKEGYDLAVKKIPDLIISDIMMPVMDGNEFCSRIKEDVRTSHIPFIMLTAVAGDESKLAAFKKGIDDYITKPFDIDLLLLRINKRLEIRDLYHKKFQKHIEINPADIEVSSIDQILIKKAIAYVEKNISESDFSVEDLSQELGMSRVYLYKKLLAITGKTPIEFIRIIRLKRAVQLLEKSDLSVSEIAYSVGFNNPRYFTKYFKDEYGLLPSQYQQEFGKNDTPQE
jgi:signal transduction histidine kinase/ligand-binding sensor domain-containing protein/DNA-binding response OmpR family regulator